MTGCFLTTLVEARVISCSLKQAGRMMHSNPLQGFVPATLSATASEPLPLRFRYPSFTPPAFSFYLCLFLTFLPCLPPDISGVFFFKALLGAMSPDNICVHEGLSWNSFILSPWWSLNPSDDRVYWGPHQCSAWNTLAWEMGQFLGHWQTLNGACLPCSLHGQIFNMAGFGMRERGFNTIISGMIVSHYSAVESSTGMRVGMFVERRDGCLLLQLRCSSLHVRLCHSSPRLTLLLFLMLEMLNVGWSLLFFCRVHAQIERLGKELHVFLWMCAVPVCIRSMHVCVCVCVCVCL